MPAQKAIHFAFFILFSIIVLFIALSFEASSSYGANNVSVLAKVKVKNTPPNITSIVISPTEVDLIAGNKTQVNCTAYAWDYNGWDDINYTNVTLYNYAISSSDGLNDHNYHYTNDTCACQPQGGSPSNATCICTFDVRYYATNGTWMCNFTVGDGEFTSSKNKSFAVNTLIGVDVPAELNFGNLSVMQTSNMIPANVSNWGNVAINISVRAYGGTNDSTPNAGNYSMMCEYGTIGLDNMRYSINASSIFLNMVNITNTTSPISDISLPIRTNDTNYETDTNTTYWKMYIPQDVGGYCNGTIQFTGLQI